MLIIYIKYDLPLISLEYTNQITIEAIESINHFFLPDQKERYD